MRRTNAQRRRAKQLDECADWLTVSDCEFCDSRQRSYRIRLADPCEIAQLEMQLGVELVLPRGRKLFAVIKRLPVKAQTVLKVLTENDANVATDDDLDEEFCHALFESIAPPEALEAEADYVRARS